jgi:hypothetical protein
VLLLGDHVVPERKSKSHDFFRDPSDACSSSFDVDLPLEVDDEYWETKDPEKAFQQPPGKPSKIAGFNSYLKLTKISAYALRTIVRFPTPPVFFTSD